MIPLTDDVPVRRTPVITWALIWTNVAIFLFELSLGSHLQTFVEHWAVNPHRFIMHHDMHEFATIFASMFMHGGWLHLIGNMWALFIFGDNVEDRMGHGRYLLFYLMSGIIAGLTQVFMTAHTSALSLGASGAVAGTMAAYMMYYPHARVRTWFGFIFILMLPAWFVVGEWFVVQLLNGFSVIGDTTAKGGIAFFAHIGGFVFGLLFAKLFQDPDYREPLPIFDDSRSLERVHM